MTATFLFLYTEPPTREVLARHRPGRMVLASDEVTAEDREVYDECVELPPATEVGETLRRLERIAADRVVVQTEYGLLPGALLARARGEPAPSPEAALRCTNKWLCRRALHEAGVPVPRFALVSTALEARRFAAGRWPIVLKPVASTLARLVTRVDSEAELEESVRLLRAALPESIEVRRCQSFARVAGLDLGCDPTREFLVEEFAEGPTLETDGLVFGDRIWLFGVTGQIVSPPPLFYIEGYLFPVERPGLARITEQAIRAVGLRDAGFSIEFRGERVIEVNGRLGEDAGFPDLFRAGLGSYPILDWLEGRAPAPARGGHALAYANWYEDGVVRRTPSDAGAAGARVLVRPGGRLFAPPHPDVAPHLAYALASHRSDARLAYEAARARVDRLGFEIDPAP